MRVENNVYAYVRDDMDRVRYNVIDRVRQAEEQVANEHRQHGPRALVHHLARPCCVWSGGQAAFVAYYLRGQGTCVISEVKEKIHDNFYSLL